jgi:peptidoglycan/LPS O-acetylase OafA/YrhL
MKRIEPLEGLRGLLALWVVLGHSLAAAGLGADWRGPFKVLAAGGNAVDVFIILSGFVIFFLLDCGRENYGRFIWRRLLRLYPCYVVCLVVSLAIIPSAVDTLQQLPWDHPLNHSRLLIFHDTMADLAAQVAVHLTMLHAAVPSSILPSSAYAILGQAWSISLEWQFYLVAPIVFWALKSSSIRATTIVIGTACASHFLIAGWDGALPRHVGLFGVGIGSYFLWRAAPPPSLKAFTLAATALTYLVSPIPGLVVWAGVFSAIYAPKSAGASSVVAFLELRAVQFLGRISYSIYLSHAILMYVAMGILSGHAEQLGSWCYFAVLVTMTVTMTILVSAILYRFVEAPFIRLGKGIATSPARVGGQLANAEIE